MCVAREKKVHNAICENIRYKLLFLLYKSYPREFVRPSRSALHLHRQAESAGKQNGNDIPVVGDVHLPPVLLGNLLQNGVDLDHEDLGACLQGVDSVTVDVDVLTDHAAVRTLELVEEGKDLHTR